MKREFKIPKMSNEDIAKRYATIKPIVGNNGIPTYLRNLSDTELTATAYTWLNKSSDYAEPVDFSKLSVLTDVKMLHPLGKFAFFRPNVGEIIRQIPKESLEKVVAFQIVRGAVGTLDIFNDEFKAGFYVSIVRLYQAKNSTNDVAKPTDEYPTDDSKVPIGMTEKEFQGLKKTFGPKA